MRKGRDKNGRRLWSAATVQTFAAPETIGAVLEDNRGKKIKREIPTTCSLRQVRAPVFSPARRVKGNTVVKHTDDGGGVRRVLAIFGPERFDRVTG